MTADQVERLRRLKLLFEGALENPLELRETWLREQCAGDPALLAEVLRLLADDQRINDARVNRSDPKEPAPLPQFGLWKAIRELGRGGMGVVYLAERADGEFRMQAAVKVVPLALASHDIEERFRRERQFLASLDHPKIARLIDGGTHAGLPYLVMDYVDGLPIDRYCEAHNLDQRARIALARQVLDALIYVHARQVIHRDLKSSNILVGSAGVKLLDFGTARLVDATGDTAITKTGVFAFTPEYASPEQVQGRTVTFASDIYSAGVLLYRLLTGRAPYQVTDPATVATARPAPSGLEAPLDAIVSKALRKNPEERYASAQEMDADLARYLAGRPVEARSPRSLYIVAAAVAIACLGAGTSWYAFHRRVAATPPSIAVLPFTGGGYLAGGVTGEIAEDLARQKTLRVISQASAAQAARQKDLRKAGQMLNVTNLLTGSVEPAGDRIKVVASLVRTSDGVCIWTNTYRRPMADLNVIETDLGLQIAGSLGLAKSDGPKKHVPNQQAHDLYLKARFEENQPTAASNALAQQDYRRALELDPRYADAWAGLGAAIWNLNNGLVNKGVHAERRQAVEYLQKAIQLDPANARAHSMLGLYAMHFDWDWKRAERELQLGAAGHASAGETGLALLYEATGRRIEAEEHQRIARDLDPVSPVGLFNSAMFLFNEGRWAEAREEYRKLAATNPALEDYQAQLDGYDGRMGRLDQAIRNLRGRRQTLGVVANLAILEALAGHRDEALRIIRSLEESNQDGHIAMIIFAQIYADLGDEPKTVQYLERAMDLHEGGAIFIRVHPDFAKFQDTPEFHRLKKRMNLDW